MYNVKDKKKLAKKLNPPPRSRYLPGEVDMNMEKSDLKMFTEHRVNVVFAEAKIDNKAPKFNPLTYLKEHKLAIDAARIRYMDKENKELLKKINIINRMGGKVDSWNSKIKHKSRYPEKETENKEIEKKNKDIWKRISGALALYPTVELLRDWKRIESNLESMSRYPSRWKETEKISQSRIRCYFDIEVEKSKEQLGRIIFELYDDFVPKTCANFEALCRGDNGLSYKNTPLHRIVKGFWCQGGDVTKFNGSGGASIYGEKFDDETFLLKHTGPGVLSMWSSGENTNNSKFNITFKQLETMDGKRIVLGKIVKGMSNLYKIEEMGTKSGKPMKNVIVSKCGVLQRRNSHFPKRAQPNEEKEGEDE